MADAQPFFWIQSLLIYLVIATLFGVYVFIRYTDLSLIKVVVAGLAQAVIAFLLLRFFVLLLEWSFFPYAILDLEIFSIFGSLISPLFLIAELLSLLITGIGVHILCKDKNK